MKRIIILIIALLILLTFVGCASCNGCNQMAFDGILKFDEAVIRMPDGTILRGTVEKWNDYEDGDQLQVRIDGTWYLVHSSNIVLIAH